MGEMSWSKLLMITLFVFTLISATFSASPTTEFRDASATVTSKLYQEFSKNNEQGNMLFSPISIATGLAMLAEGSKGETLTIIEDVTGLTEKARKQFEIITESLKANHTSAVRMVNSIWIPIDKKMPQTFALKTKKYSAETRSAAFDKGDEVVKAINERIRKITNGLVKDLVPAGSVSSDTRVLLTNALYFNGKWAYTFDKENTRDSNFRTSSGELVRVKMMNSKLTLRCGHSTPLKATVASLPYADANDRFSMIIIVPDEENGYKSVEKELFQDPDLLRKTVNRLTTKEIELSLPNFGFEPTVDLKAVLQKMGLGQLFTERANIPGIIYQQNAVLSSAIHKAKINVNEAGTEAAAASVFQIIPLMADYDTTREVRANRTFVFAIWDSEYDYALFVGRVANPSEAETQTVKKHASIHKKKEQDVEKVVAVETAGKKAKRQILFVEAPYRQRPQREIQLEEEVTKAPLAAEEEEGRDKGVTGPANWWKPTPNSAVVIKLTTPRPEITVAESLSQGPVLSVNKNPKPRPQQSFPTRPPPSVMQQASLGSSLIPLDGDGPVAFVGQFIPIRSGNSVGSMLSASQPVIKSVQGLVKFEGLAVRETEKVGLKTSSSEVPVSFEYPGSSQ